MDVNIDKFSGVLDSINLNVLKQSSFMESMYQMEVDDRLTQAKQTSVLEKLLDLKKLEIDMIKESSEDKLRKDRLEDVSQPQPIDNEPKIREPESGGSLDMGELGLRSLLTAAMITPFAYKFAEGFLNEITDGLIELTPDGLAAALRIPALSTAFSNATKVFSGVDKISELLGPLGKIFDKIGDGAKAVSSSRYLSTIGTFFSSLPGLGGMLGLFKKIVWPIGIIFSVFEGVKEFRETEGSKFEKIGGFIGGFLGELIGAPFDLIKNAGAWIIDKMGFSSGAKIVKDFSFEELISDITKSMFGVVQDMVHWVKTLFTDPKEALNTLWSKTLEGVESLTDLLYLPVNLAINWIRGIFKWGDPEEDFKLQDWIASLVPKTISWVKGLFEWSSEAMSEEFSLSDMLSKKLEELTIWFRDLFDFIPSLEDIKAKLMGALPEWMQPKTVEEKRESKIKDLNAEREGLLRKIKEQQSYINASKTGENVYYGYEVTGRKESQRKIDYANKRLAQIERQASTMDISLKEPKILDNKSSLLDKWTDAISSESGRAAGSFMYIKGGDNITGGSTIRGGDTTVNTINRPMTPASALQGISSRSQ